MFDNRETGRDKWRGKRTKAPQVKRARWARRRRARLAVRLRNYFLTGILVTAPVSITLWLSWKMVSLVDSRVRPLIPPQWNPENYLPFGLPGLGILVALVGLTLIGLFTTGILGRFIAPGDELLLRLPDPRIQLQVLVLEHFDLALAI